jgi:uncharacterized membrane protein
MTEAFILMETYKDSRVRSVIKAISWRIFATMATILIVFAFTGKIILSLEIGGVEIVVKLALYYFHERIWSSVPRGGGGGGRAAEDEYGSA